MGWGLVLAWIVFFLACPSSLLYSGVGFPGLAIYILSFSSLAIYVLVWHFQFYSSIFWPKKARPSLRRPNQTIPKKCQARLGQKGQTRRRAGVRARGRTTKRIDQKNPD